MASTVIVFAEMASVASASLFPLIGRACSPCWGSSACWTDVRPVALSHRRTRQREEEHQTVGGADHLLTSPVQHSPEQLERFRCRVGIKQERS
jgi:hypothetical protein